MMKKTLYMVLAAFLAACHFETQSALLLAEYTAPGSAWQKDLESKDATAMEMLKTGLQEMSGVVPSEIVDDSLALFRLMPVFTLDSVKCRNYSSEEELLSLLIPDNDRVFAVYTAQDYSIFREFHTESIMTGHVKPNYLTTVWPHPEVTEHVRTAISTDLPMMALCVHPGLHVRSYMYCCLQDGHWIVWRGRRGQKKLADVLKGYVEGLPIIPGGMLQ